MSRDCGRRASRRSRRGTATGCRVKRIERYVKGDSFMLTYGDGLSDVNLTQLRTFHRRHGRLATVTAVRSPGRFGEMEIAQRQVTSFQEKPPHAQGRISGGFFVLNREIFQRLPDDEGLIFEHEPLLGLVREAPWAA